MLLWVRRGWGAGRIYRTEGRRSVDTAGTARGHQLRLDAQDLWRVWRSCGAGGPACARRPVVGAFLHPAGGWQHAGELMLMRLLSFFLSLSLSASLHTQSHTFNIQRTYNEPKLNETRTVLLSCCTGGVSWAAVAVGCQPSSRLQRHLWQFGKSCRVSSGRRQVLVQVGSVCMVGTSIVVFCMVGTSIVVFCMVGTSIVVFCMVDASRAFV